MVGIGRSGHGARGVGLGAAHRRGRGCLGRVSIVRRGGKQGRKWLGSIITPLANSPLPPPPPTTNVSFPQKPDAWA